MMFWLTRDAKKHLRAPAVVGRERLAGDRGPM
jgi:hypothetical protein